MESVLEKISEKEEAIIEEFALFDDWMDKYEHIIGLGKELPLIEDGLKSDDLLIRGCQSRVWLHAKMENTIVTFTADSDAIITKGIISLLVRVLSGQTPAEIIETDLNFIQHIGLKEHLSPTRSNGLVSMVKQMKLYALAFKTQQNG
ncbi:MAG: cysteine desulfuration protein SufE [Bacteroidia bacterium]|jgi:cysteine desulfuration protein SufE